MTTTGRGARGAPVPPEGCDTGTHLGPMGDSMVLHPAEHPWVHSTASPQQASAGVWKCRVLQDPVHGVQDPAPGTLPGPALTQKPPTSVRGPRAFSESPSIPALGSTGCQQWVTAATAEQLLQIHTLAPPRCRQRVTAPTSDTGRNTLGHRAPLVLASLQPFCLHPSECPAAGARHRCLGRSWATRAAGQTCHLLLQPHENAFSPFLTLKLKTEAANELHRAEFKYRYCWEQN